jgi:hypothetical protein
MCMGKWHKYTFLSSALGKGTKLSSCPCPFVSTSHCKSPGIATVLIGHIPASPGIELESTSLRVSNILGQPP